MVPPLFEMLNVLVVPFPQAFEGVTVSVCGKVDPAFRVMELVPCPEAILQPDPVMDQV